MITVPCKDCQDRAAGCHSICAKYAEYKKAMDGQRQKKEDTDHIDGAIYSDLLEGVAIILLALAVTFSRHVK